jgi:hypothetical protein
MCRWINGTLASFAFFFASGRAVSRVNGGLFDTHKVGKNMRAVNVLWLMMIIQYVFVLMLAPAVFMFLSADGLKELAKNNPETLGWTIQDAAGFAFVDFWLIVVLVIYIGWMFLSFYTPVRYVKYLHVLPDKFLKGSSATLTARLLSTEASSHVHLFINFAAM